MNQLLPRYYRRTLARLDAAAVDEAVGTPTEPERAPRYELAKPADTRVLRMLPVHARGVCGVIPGTDPEAALVRKESSRER